MQNTRNLHYTDPSTPDERLTVFDRLNDIYI